jgi:hypothetical protein
LRHFEPPFRNNHVTHARYPAPVQPQRGGDLGAAFREDRQRCSKAKRRQHSPLEQHAELLLGLITNQPDLTLDEIVAAMRKRRIADSRSAVWRFFARRNISFKKNSVRGGAEACGRSPRTPALAALRRIGRVVTDFSPQERRKFLSPCRLCSNMTGICSNCTTPAPD